MDGTIKNLPLGPYRAGFSCGVHEEQGSSGPDLRAPQEAVTHHGAFCAWSGQLLHEKLQQS